MQQCFWGNIVQCCEYIVRKCRKNVWVASVGKTQTRFQLLPLNSHYCTSNAHYALMFFIVLSDIIKWLNEFQTWRLAV